MKSHERADYSIISQCRVCRLLTLPTRSCGGLTIWQVLLHGLYNYAYNRKATSGHGGSGRHNEYSNLVSHVECLAVSLLRTDLFLYLLPGVFTSNSKGCLCSIATICEALVTHSPMPLHYFDPGL